MSMKQLYVVIDWPESQIIPQFPREYSDQCLEVNGTHPTYAVPVEIWNDYLMGKIGVE